MRSIRRLATVALGWNVLVILLGALVRATASGAGCGRSWPSCQGELLPELQGATAIEFTHRAASGIALILVAALVFNVLRTAPRGPLRSASILSGIAIVAEALIGAVIVLYEWVEHDASLARTISVPVHLVNTLVLLAGLTLTLYWSANPDRKRSAGVRTDRRALFGFGAGMVAIAATGAVTALADTLFPSESLAAGLAEDFAGTGELLTELRVIHPIVAILVGIAMARWAARRRITRDDRAARPARAVVTVVGVELLVGVANVVFLTPIVVQLLHLLLADLLWIAWVWLGAEVLSEPAEQLVAAE